MRVRIKICGLTRSQDALGAVDAGADALGLNFVRTSKRYVTPEQAARIAHSLPPLVSTVGLFVDPDSAQVRSVLSTVPLSFLQFQGAETDAFCASFGVPYLKGIRMQGPLSASDLRERFPNARAALLDAHIDGAHGGTGQRFDWSWVPKECVVPLVLAGGLTPENVAEAIERTRPFAVDVCSGVEHAPGIKDLSKMRSFIHEVQRVGG